MCLRLCRGKASRVYVYTTTRARQALLGRDVNMGLRASCGGEGEVARLSWRGKVCGIEFGVKMMGYSSFYHHG
jgi:hypothetical protein